MCDLEVPRGLVFLVWRERQRQRQRDFAHDVILIEIAKRIISCYNFKRLWQELCSCEKFVLNGV